VEQGSLSAVLEIAVENIAVQFHWYEVTAPLVSSRECRLLAQLLVVLMEFQRPSGIRFETGLSLGGKSKMMFGFTRDIRVPQSASVSVEEARTRRRRGRGRELGAGRITKGERGLAVEGFSRVVSTQSIPSVLPMKCVTAP